MTKKILFGYLNIFKNIKREQMNGDDLPLIISNIKTVVKLNKHYLLYNNFMFKRFNKNKDN